MTLLILKISLRAFILYLNMKGTLIKDSNKALAHLLMQILSIIKENLLIIKQKDMELFFRIMEMWLLGVGLAM